MEPGIYARGSRRLHVIKVDDVSQQVIFALNGREYAEDVNSFQRLWKWHSAAPVEHVQNTSAVQGVVSRIQGDVVAVGGYDGWPNDGRHVSIGTDHTLKDAKAIVDATMSSPNVRLAVLLGSMVTSRNETQLLSHIADKLPGSNVICLNIGEFGSASLDAYQRIVAALPHSIVGHMYWNKGKGPCVADDLVEQAQIYLRQNRRKTAYKVNLLQVEPYMRKGCNAWWNPQPSTFQQAHADLRKSTKSATQLRRGHGTLGHTAGFARGTARREPLGHS